MMKTSKKDEEEEKKKDRKGWTSQELDVTKSWLSQRAGCHRSWLSKELVVWELDVTKLDVWEVVVCLSIKVPSWKFPGDLNKSRDPGSLVSRCVCAVHSWQILKTMFATAGRAVADSCSLQTY